MQRRVHRLEHARDTESVRCESSPQRSGPYKLGGIRSVQCGRRTLSGDVTNRNDKRLRFGREKIVDVSSELIR